MGPSLLVRAQIGQRIAVEDRPGLDRIQTQRAVLMAQLLHRLRDPILSTELLVNSRHRRQSRRRGPGPVEPGGDAVVGELGMIDHNRRIDVRFAHRAVKIGCHLDHDGQPLLTFGERREVGGKLLGKHRKDLGGRVNGRGVGPRVTVDRGALLDDRVDVGHRDEDPHRAAVGWRRDRELIEIARIVVVDRRPQQAAKVAERSAGGGRRSRDCVALRHSRDGEIRQQAPLMHRLSRDVLEPVPARRGFLIHRRNHTCPAAWSTERRVYLRRVALLAKSSTSLPPPRYPEASGMRQ